jgi:hypothetical protein
MKSGRKMWRGLLAKIADVTTVSSQAIAAPRPRRSPVAPHITGVASCSARPHGEADAAELCEGLSQAQQE